MPPEVFEQYPVLTWKVGKKASLKFPACSIQETGGNRIVERNRPYRDGAKLDDVGSKATRWTIEAIFENSVQEEGFDASTPLYPNVMNAVIETFRVHGTGDLTLPTRGKVRVRAESYTRSETETERDYGKLSLTFCEDNEDNIDAQSFEAPTVNASAKRITETTEFDAQSEGAWGTTLGELREFGSELEGIANFPGDSLDDVDSQSAIVVSTANSVVRTFDSPRGGEKLKDPEMSRTQRKLEQTKDMAAKARADARAGRPTLATYPVLAASDLFTIAASIGQDPNDLLDINPGVNALFILANTILNIFDEL